MCNILNWYKVKDDHSPFGVTTTTFVLHAGGSTSQENQPAKGYFQDNKKIFLMFQKYINNFKKSIH